MAAQLSSKPSESLPDTPNDELDHVQATNGTDAPPASADRTEQPPSGESTRKAPPDAVTKALDAIKDGSASTVDEDETPTPAKPADKVEPKAKDAPAKPATDDQHEKPAGKDPAKDPLADWTPMEREHTKGKVKERFRKLHEMNENVAGERDKLAADLAAAQDDATYGRAFREIGEKFQVKPDMDLLTDEQVAWSVRSQAAALRSVNAIAAGKQPTQGDLETIDMLREGLDLVNQHLGRTKPKGPEIDHKAVLDLIDEVENTLDPAAFEKLRKLVGIAPADEHAPPVKPEVAQPRRFQQQEPQQAQPPAVDPALESQRVRTVNAIVQSGIPQAQVQAHYEEHLMPLVAAALRRDNPRLHPDVAWQRTPPAERTALILEAIVTEQKGRRVAQPIPPASRTTSPAAPIRSMGRAPAPTRSTSSGDPVRDAIDRVRSGAASTSDQ